MGDTLFAIHGTTEELPKSAWFSHYGLEGKETLGQYLFMTGAYHIAGRNDILKKAAYQTDFKYAAILHASDVPAEFLTAARATGADIVFSGKHTLLDIGKVARLDPPWFGPEWKTSFSFLGDKATAAGMKVVTLDLPLPEAPTDENHVINFGPTDGPGVDIMVPCSHSKIPMRFWMSMITMNMRHVRRILVCGDEDVCSARNKLVKEFLSGDSEYGLFCDVDMSFPPETVDRLLSHRAPIVGGVYYQRQPPFYPHVYDNLGGHEHPRTKRLIDIKYGAKCDNMGTGCLMVHRSVYQKLPEPWFYLRYYNLDNLVGEDIGFGLDIKKAGYRYVMDDSLDIGHFGSLIADKALATQHRAGWR